MLGVDLMILTGWHRARFQKNYPPSILAPKENLARDQKKYHACSVVQCADKKHATRRREYHAYISREKKHAVHERVTHEIHVYTKSPSPLPSKVKWSSP